MGSVTTKILYLFFSKEAAIRDMNKTLVKHEPYVPKKRLDCITIHLQFV